MLSGERSLLGYEEFTRLRDRSKTLSGLCAAQMSLENLPVRISGGSQEQARGRLVSETYFAVFGVKPAIGRLLTQSDAAGTGQDPYAVISYDYWRRGFGENPSVLGTTIRIHNATLVIIGVAAAGFRGETVGQDPDLWLPLLMQPLVMPGWDGLHDFMDVSQDKLMWLHAFGRRKPGVTIAEVQAEMNVLFRQLLRPTTQLRWRRWLERLRLTRTCACEPCDRERFTAVRNSLSSGPSYRLWPAWFC